MTYQSTRNSALRVESSRAIMNGISAEGGLFVPCGFPAFSYREFSAMAGESYISCAVNVLEKFLTDFTGRELLDCASAAYSGEKFGGEHPAPLFEYKPGRFIQELWHGPTCAFKDMALQLLPHLLTASVKKQQSKDTQVILVATSGDTGKAALEGFRDVPGTKIMVFYPEDGVSVLQKKQMMTQEGGNVAVLAVRGNFDDAQTGVKKIFTDSETGRRLAQSAMSFSSANSINWGRLVPQIVYYVRAYCDLIKAGKITKNERFNVVVPTGNFGNILAAYYAKKMGVPVGRLICASNKNHILTDFINTGIYDRNRAFYTTMSPSMDILISSNLERLIFDLCGSDQKVRDWMAQLSSEGRYEADAPLKEKLAEGFWADFATEEQTAQVIYDMWKNHNYLCDTHTAVALHVFDKYREATGDMRNTVIVSTASPFKFTANVLGALKREPQTGDEFAMARELSALTGVPMPEPIAGLAGKPDRFTGVFDVADMNRAVFETLDM